MEILFTYNNSALSRMIRSLTKEPVSHCALRLGDFVIHSTVFGPEIRTYEYFRHRNVVLASVPVGIPDAAAVELITKTDRAGYDYAALAYLGLRYLAKVYFRCSIPKANLWKVSGLYLCTELITVFMFGKADAMITPYQLLLKLKATKE